MRRFGGMTAFLLVAAGIACTTNDGVGQVAEDVDELQRALTAGPWQPETVRAERMPADSGMSISFSDDGRVTGNAGCNQFFGGYELTADGIRMGPIGATRKYCMEPVMSRETAFLQALEQVRRLSIDDGALELLDANDEVLLTFATQSSPGE